MKKIISFSLYGNEGKYTQGAICNAELAKIIYPDWICRFYYGDSVPIDIIQRLKSFDHVEMVNMVENNEFSYMAWRFLAYDDDIDVVLSRDADSRLSFREKKLVDMFISSDFLFHDVRDHPLHLHTMGGTWGMKKGAIPSMIELITENKIGMSYGKDQDFMFGVIGPLLKDKTLIHDSNNMMNFPIKNEDIISNISEPVNKNHRHFIGEIFPEDNYNKPYNHVFY
jgi:hypothetical protein